ncbi:MAG: cryptochrome/photolyase family protein [Actinomycetes bacterium]
MPSVMWFRRDLRLNDHPALNAAIDSAFEDGDKNVVALFNIDPKVFDDAGNPLKAYQDASLKSLDESLNNNLLIRHGDPKKVIVEVAKAAKAKTVHISEDFEPYGRKRDVEVEKELAKNGIKLIRTGSAYAVAPFRVTKDDGTPYRVFTPFYRSWVSHGWRKPAPKFKKEPNWIKPLKNEGRPKVTSEIEIPKAGEKNALDLFTKFLKSGIKGYDQNRNRPDLEGTSKLSIPLRFGEIHPRTILMELNDSKDHDTYRKEICWREFYAEVLATAPESETKSLDQKWELMGWDLEKDYKQKLKIWQEGKTGFPLVDAGMRQLKESGWMHNRVRMVVASFLVKDLHIHWRHGADWFMKHLLDGDIASNSHGWQWTAGCGTDASPYYRIFNPMMQAEKFDPNADYVRKWIPELRHLKGINAHTPWDQVDGYKHGYPKRMVDHQVERDETLRRYKASKGEKVIKEKFSR